MTYSDIDFSSVNLENLKQGTALTTHSGKEEIIAYIEPISAAIGKLWTIFMKSGKIYSVAKYYPTVWAEK